MLKRRTVLANDLGTMHAEIVGLYAIIDMKYFNEMQLPERKYILQFYPHYF